MEYYLQSSNKPYVTDVCNFTKVTLLQGCFSRSLIYANGTKSPKESHIIMSECALETHL